jgi:hypothetical protein
MIVAFEARQSAQKVLVENFFPIQIVAPAWRVAANPRIDAEEWYSGMLCMVLAIFI